MKTNYGYIKRLTEDFISESIRTENPAGLCFSTALPLMIYLATKQIKCRLMTGKVPRLKDDDGPTEVDHFWLQIDDEGTILDPTIQQFSGDQAIPIYIGKIKDHEVTNQYVVCDLPSYFWFPEVYDSWKTIYVDQLYPLKGEFQKRSIMYTLKLATILNTEIKKLSFSDRFIYRHAEIYFKPLYVFLYNWHTRKINFEIAKEKLPDEFNNLLSDAIRWAESKR